MTIKHAIMENIRIFCENDRSYHKVPVGTALKELSEASFRTVPDEKSGMELPVLAALVDNRLKELEFNIIMPHTIRFIGYNHPDGRRTYIRSLCFVLRNAVKEMFPDKVLAIDYSLPSGLYCEIHERRNNEDGRPCIYYITDEELEEVKAKMQEIISRDMPFRKVKMTFDEAQKIFLDNGQEDKARLLSSIGHYTYSVYFLDGEADTFYGPLVPSTGYLKVFDLMGFNNGFCLQFPAEGNVSKVMPMKRQSKLAATLKEYADWCAILGVTGIGSLNKSISSGRSVELINLSEALHERKYADIADQINMQRGRVKIVFIAGPSSSGKTSSSKRLAIQCKVVGLNPKVIELDNYFVDREKTPKDENGEYDFEALEAMDLQLLNSQLNDLLDGKEVELPRFDFKEGRRLSEDALRYALENCTYQEGPETEP